MKTSPSHLPKIAEVSAHDSVLKMGEPGKGHRYRAAKLKQPLLSGFLAQYNTQTMNIFAKMKKVVHIHALL